MPDRRRLPPIVVWLRRDLRLGDNPAFAPSRGSDRAVIPLFIDDDGTDSARALGGAAKWWRGRSLAALDQALRRCGARLVIRRGSAAEILPAFMAEAGASTLSFNLSREPARIAEDTAIIAAMRARGIAVEAHDANYLHDPAQLRTAAGGAFKVFTPFWNRLAALYQPPAEHAAPLILPSPDAWPQGIDVADLQVTDAWAKSLAAHWQPGEAAARKRLEEFAAGMVSAYAAQRDRPDVDGTSRLSPHLAWGEISVHEIWRRLRRRAGDAAGAKAMPFLREIGWRDFNMHLLSDFPALPWKPWQEKFAAFPAKDDAAALRAWRRGQTGYPIVDAGLRQLWRTGWMHNRVRMIVGSFLVKDLMIPWQRGEEWFWDTLVDADPAQNAGNWQWVAGCGADAAPFFRVFNPTLQGQKFDPTGAYVRRWVPELAKLPDTLIHEPWRATGAQLAKAGIKLGRSYPAPMVDHAKARLAALAAYQRLGKDAIPDGDSQASLL